MSIKVRVRKDGKKSYLVTTTNIAGKAEYATRHSRREAEQLERERKVLKQTGQLPPDRNARKITLRQMLEKRAERMTRDRSERNVTTVIGNLGELGDMPIVSIKRADVEAWLRTLVTGRPWADGKALAPSSAATYFAVVRASLNDAVNAEPPLIPYSPARGVKAPRATRAIGKDSLITAADLDKLIDAGSEPYINGRGHTLKPAPGIAVAMLLASETGLRPSEVAGLLVREVDLDRERIYVRMQAAPSGRGRGPLKTASSERDVPVSARLHEALSVHLKGKKPGDRVFTLRTGSPYTGPSFATAMARVRNRALPGTSWHPHSLRHYYATRLIFQGVDLPSVSRALGHSTTAETAAVYVHVIPGDAERIKAALAASWS